MKLYEKIKEIKKTAKGEIVIVKSGGFYIAVDTDAVFLHELLGLECTCHKRGMCRVGVPINSIDKYFEKLMKSGYGFLIYDVVDNKLRLRNMNLSNKIYNEENYISNCKSCPRNNKDIQQEKLNLDNIISEIKEYKEKLENGEK